MHGALHRRLFAVLLSFLVLRSQPLAAEDRTELAISMLELGGSVGELLWTAGKSRSASIADADLYQRLAQRIQQQIDDGRLASSLVRVNFDVLGTILVYAATVDPEPLSKTAAGVSAWAAKKTGDAVAEMVIEKSREQARKLAALGLKNEKLTREQLRNMSSAQIGARLGDLRIGGQKIRDLLQSEDIFRLVEAQTVDLAAEIGVEAITRTEVIAADVASVKQDLLKTHKDLQNYKIKVKAHLDKIEGQVTGLHAATILAGQKLAELQRATQDQSQSLQVLAQVSYAGWSTAQKLQAVESGLFPGLSSTQRQAMVDSLKADKQREAALVTLQTAARDLGGLVTIASSIGLPNEVVTGLQKGQLVATGLAKVAGGDVLGAIASITSLVGLGAPDAAAQRHQQMMAYLQQQFAEIHQKLNQVIDLQIKTYNALVDFAEEQRKFQIEVLSRLDRMENSLLRNENRLLALQLDKWSSCDALIGGKPLNGQFQILSRDALFKILLDPSTARNAAGCYAVMTGYFDAKVKAAGWGAGEIIAAGNLPEQGWAVFRDQKLAEYARARDFVLAALPAAGTAPAGVLARFAQPVADVHFSNRLGALFEEAKLKQRFQGFKCNEHDVLSASLKDLLCHLSPPGEASPPYAPRWSNLLDAPLVGPQALKLIDTGIVLATLSDFAIRRPDDTFVFPSEKDLEDLSRTGTSAHMRRALKDGGGKGIKLLERLGWLTEMMVLQQAIAYGDYTARLIEQVLYDPATRSLNTSAADPVPQRAVAKQRALEAMKANPVLARNVVMLAMRHAIADQLGSADEAERVKYASTYYGLALQDLTGSQACTKSLLPRRKLAELFPNWKFEFYVSTEQRKADKAFEGCPAEHRPAPGESPRGVGVAVVFPDFYVVAPMPPVVADGVFEQAEGLRVALQYRDRLHQAQVDRTILRTIEEVAGNQAGARARLGAALLNEGWGWHRAATRRVSPASDLKP